MRRSQRPSDCASNLPNPHKYGHNVAHLEGRAETLIFGFYSVSKEIRSSPSARFWGSDGQKTPLWEPFVFFGGVGGWGVSAVDKMTRSLCWGGGEGWREAQITTLNGVTGVVGGGVKRMSTILVINFPYFVVIW